VFVIHQLLNSIWNKEELPDQWKESTIVPIQKRMIKLTAILLCDISAINFLHGCLICIYVSDLFQHWLVHLFDD
jgi:hypothetical protein